MQIGNKNVMSQFNQDFDVEKLAQMKGWEYITGNGSSKKWPKYIGPNGDKILINTSKNTFFSTCQEFSGGPANFIGNMVLGIRDTCNKEWFDELISIGGYKTDRPAADLSNIKRTEHVGTSKKDRAAINASVAKCKKFLTDYCRPAAAHPYLTDARKINADYILNPKFKNCLRRPSEGSKAPDNVLAVHRDVNGICSHESHFVGFDRDCKLYRKDAPKCVWHTDDIYSKDIDTIFVGEAVMDCISAGSLSKGDMALMTCGGAILVDKELGNTVPMLKKIFTKTHAKNIVLGNDNDKAGIKYDEFYIDFLNKNFPDKFNISVQKPPMGINDWNDYLKVVEFSDRTPLMEFAKATNELIIAEGGIGKFKMLRSAEHVGTTVLIIPPNGFNKNTVNIVKAYMNVMKENNEHSVVTYTRSSNNNFKYVKDIRTWHKEYLPSLEFKTSPKSNIVDSLLKAGKLPDKTISPTWKGYTEVKKYPHKLAKHAKRIVLTKSLDDKVRYYHSSYPPVTTIIGVPNNSSIDEMMKESNIKQITGFLRLAATNCVKTDKPLKIVVSPSVQENGKRTLSHCSFLKLACANSYNSVINTAVMEKGSLGEGVKSVLHALADNDLLQSDHFKPKNVSGLRVVPNASQKQNTVPATRPVDQRPTPNNNPQSPSAPSV